MSSEHSIEPGDITVSHAIAALMTVEREIAKLEAAKIMQFAAVMRVAMQRVAHRPRVVRERELALRSIAAEIAVALRWSDRTVQQRLGEAVAMVDAFPRTLEALAAGSIDARHAAVVRELGDVLSHSADRAVFEARVLERAMTDTVARTAAFARVIVEELHPDAPTERCAQASRRRRVWIQDDVDGMATLGVFDEAVKIRAMFDRLTQQSRAIRSIDAAGSSSHAGSGDTGPSGAETVGRGGDEPADDGTATTGGSVGDDVPAGGAPSDRRSIDQVRADLLCDLILTGQPAIDPTTDVLPGGLGAIRAQIAVTVPVTTASGIADRGALIEGAVPVDPVTARRLMATAPGWDRVLTHPVTGAVLAVDRYRPGAQILRFLAARDVHCRFPGCRQPARRCDVDHTEEFARGGKTRASNLASLCKRHHTLKTETPWRARQDADGSITWTSPLGRAVVDRPATYVRFEPAQEPPRTTRRATTVSGPKRDDPRADDPPPF